MLKILTGSWILALSSNGICKGLVIDFVVPVYPDHLEALSSSWVSDSASKLLIITIYWD